MRASVNCPGKAEVSTLRLHLPARPAATSFPGLLSATTSFSVAFRRRAPLRRLRQVVVWWLPISLLWACSQNVGDACENDSDCENEGRQICDTSLPGGYCTLLDCEGGGCPGEAACVGFQSSVSSAEECRSLQSRPRLQRTACLLVCSGDRDCRSGYVCQQLGENPWAATSLENRSVERVCVPIPPESSTGPSGYCQAGVGSRAVVPPIEVERDAGVSTRELSVEDAAVASPISVAADAAVVDASTTD